MGEGQGAGGEAAVAGVRMKRDGKEMLSEALKQPQLSGDQGRETTEARPDCFLWESISKGK